jgi:hypothetical protein
LPIVYRAESSTLLEAKRLLKAPTCFRICS